MIGEPGAHMATLKPGWLVLQVFNYAVFMAVVWYFSFNPSYRQLGDSEAIVTLAFGHAGERVAECEVLSQEDLEKLAPNMRKPMDCPRERSPVSLELRLDDELEVKEVYQAPGLYHDQSIDVLRDIKVTSGQHKLTISMNDNVNTPEPTYRFEQTVSLRPRQRLVIGFDPNRNGFAVNRQQDI